MNDSLFRQVRERLGWSQPDLAAWFGVTKVTILRWEQGQQAPPELHARVAQLILDAPDPTTLLTLLGPAGYHA